MSERLQESVRMRACLLVLPSDTSLHMGVGETFGKAGSSSGKSDSSSDVWGSINSASVSLKEACWSSPEVDPKQQQQQGVGLGFFCLSRRPVIRFPICFVTWTSLIQIEFGTINFVCERVLTVPQECVANLTRQCR